MMMARPFGLLRGRMVDCDLTQEDIARQLKLSMNSVSRRMNGKEPWRLDECYELMELLGLKDKQLMRYFPRGGRNE